MPQKLPKGIWYEAGRQRYRVRLYRNNTKYPGGYYRTLDEALVAREELKTKLEAIPKLRRGQYHQRTLNAPTMEGLMQQYKEQRDPNSTLKEPR